MQCFDVQSDDIEGRLDVFYYQPEFIKLERKIRKNSTKTLGDFIINISSGATPEKDESEKYYTDSPENGVPFLRVQNVTESGLSLEDCKYINFDTHSGMLKRSQVKEGDLITKITGVGRMAISSVAPKGFDGNVNQHLVAIKTESYQTSMVLAAFLNSDIGERLAFRRSTGGTRPALDYQALRTIPIVFNSNLVDIMQSAYAQKKEKEAEAQRLLNSIDGYVIDELGVKLPEFEDKKCFVVDVEELSGILSPHFFVSKPKDEKGFVELKSIAEINPSRKMNNLELDTLVPYVGLPETDNFKVKNILERPYKEVKGRNIIKKGDILFARIEPSIFNKKYIFVDDLKGYNYAFTSTEFYIVKARENVNPEFLFYMFYTTPVYNQVIGKTTGSTGRRRLDKGVFETLLIPVPPLEIQNKIAEEVKRRISEAERLKAEASKIIEEAKKQVEEMILGD